VPRPISGNQSQKGTQKALRWRAAKRGRPELPLAVILLGCHKTDFETVPMSRACAFGRWQVVMHDGL
jgi:hypothetical protein